VRDADGAHRGRARVREKGPWRVLQTLVGRSHTAALSPLAFTASHSIHPNNHQLCTQAVTTVLAECGNDIDAAIRRLNQLRIETDAAAAAAQPNNQQQQQPTNSNQQQPPASASNQQQQQQEAAAQQQQQQARQAQPAAGAADAAGPSAPAAAGPQTADQWVETLVGEMAQATDIPDARGRAAKLLHSFEHFVSSRVAAAPPQLAARLEESQRENAILKRAVQIQNARMQESAARDHELASLKTAVVQYQERLRHLELSNYSLALHLQKATGDAAVARGHNPPDVY
jgi:hypothetical protein